MRKPTFYTTLIIMVCSLTTMLAIFMYAQQETTNSLGNVTDACPQQIETAASGLIWESLSSQFAASIHY